MRTRDIVRKLKKVPDKTITVYLTGNAIYSRQCKVRLPFRFPLLSWLSWSHVGQDMLKVFISVVVDVKPEQRASFLKCLTEGFGLQGAINIVRSDYWIEDDCDMAGWVADEYSSYDWLTLGDEVLMSGTDFSHRLDEDLHTYHPKGGDPDEYEFLYVDNWIELGDQEVRLENKSRFKKWIRETGSRRAVFPDQMEFSHFLKDKELKAEVDLGGIGRISEEQMLRIAGEIKGEGDK